ncbi:hypothetical protein MBCUT_06680 [Methanobrevibacter cuticularis]|uniref:Uncharacterized protein n=1 Tax=Methanobrevibacter cuticularis TaxID=47311 RepID=A0A166EGL0_9EURY|nr:hypothetical protein [Methanobrevibacter cuticularis]KZX16630.1 hypothetical protein MBCUT_06680 [Methanobrevibacter cuticularis]
MLDTIRKCVDSFRNGFSESIFGITHTDIVLQSHKELIKVVE